MNILYCESFKKNDNNARSIHIYQVVKSLAKLGHNVVLLRAYRPENETESRIDTQSFGKQVIVCFLGLRITQPIRGILYILWSLIFEIKSFFLALKAIMKQKERFDVIYRRSRLLNSEYFLAKIFRIPLINEVNGIVVGELESNKWAGKFVLRIIDRVERFSKPRADKLIVVAPKLKALLHQDYGVPDEKIVVILNGTDTEIFKPIDTRAAREKLKLDQNHSYVCFVGAFQAWAGIENIINSAPLVLRECPDTRFLLVGDGVLKRKIISLAKKNGVYGKIIFTGIVPHQDVPLYIGASDVCVCPGAEDSRNSQLGGGSPLKLPEYMACARPVVIGSFVGIGRDLVKSGSGLAVEMRNKDGLANILISLLKNEELRQKMGENGRKLALEKYSWMKVAEQIVEVCQSLTGQRQAN